MKSSRSKSKTNARADKSLIAEPQTDVETRPKVVVGILGPVLDKGSDARRWERWRPTVSVCQHEELLIARFELLVESKFRKLAEQVVADIKTVSPETEVRLHEVNWKDAWDFEEVYGVLHDFAKGCNFQPDEEDYLIHITTGTHVAQICLFLLTESRDLPGRLLQTSPPSRDNTPDVGEYRVIDLDLSKYDQLASRFAEQHRDSVSFLKSGIETRSVAFNRLIDQIERVAMNSKSPILLTGPTGAGKSRLAKRIHELKIARRQISGPFVEVNCATLRGDHAMSNMFGHMRGAFTGATADRPGLLRSANGGLLFLDEIGELGLDEQAMLLRALEEKRFLPVGSDKEVSSDFQLIAGTNRDLAVSVRDGRFRDDLLARINLWTFQLPALRDRTEDIEPNLRFELEQFARTHGTRVTFNKEAIGRFLKFASSSEAQWSGNFRDLNAAVTRMGTFAAGGRISVEIVDEEIARLRLQWHTPSVAQHSDVDLADVFDAQRLAEIDLFDHAQLIEVIRVCRSSRTMSEAGRKLFASSRQSKSSSNDSDRLRKYLLRFGLNWERTQRT